MTFNMKWLGCLTLLVAVVIALGQAPDVATDVPTELTTVTTTTTPSTTTTTAVPTTSATITASPTSATITASPTSATITASPTNATITAAPTTNATITAASPTNSTASPEGTSTLAPTGSPSSDPTEPTTLETDSTSTPNVTTEEPPTTQAVTTTVQPPVIETYVLTDTENNDTCIVAKMEVTLSLIVTLLDGNVTTRSFMLPNDTVVDPSTATNCSKQQSTQLLELNFKGANKLTFTFLKDGGNVALSNITFDSTDLQTLFTDAASVNASANYMGGKQFETSTDFSYMCKNDVQLTLSGGNAITLSNVQWEAFRGDNHDTNFKAAKECSNDDSDVSDIVPIAVGCALAGLVVIVLIAYLVGRRQNRQRGYESV